MPPTATPPLHYRKRKFQAIYLAMSQQQPAAASEQRDAQQLPRRRGRPFPKGTSGNPNGARMRGKRYLALYGDLARDLGGEHALSAIERALLGQAVGLMVRGERVKAPDDAVRLANASARLLASLRNVRRERPPAAPSKLAAYLASTRPAAQTVSGAVDDGEAPDGGDAT